MRQVKSCGVLVFRREPELSFLVMHHSDRVDLPKGHIKKKESELECAWRELTEETGLTPAEVRLEEGYRYVSTYYPRYARFGGEQVEKSVILFLGWLEKPRAIVVSEHGGFEWIAYDPPHVIQPTIDGALEAAQLFFEKSNKSDL